MRSFWRSSSTSAGADVLAELQQNVKERQTDHVDLLQIHAVNVMADLETALAPDGAIIALEEARRQGMTRFVGFAGHARPWVWLMRWSATTSTPYWLRLERSIVW